MAKETIMSETEREEKKKQSSQSLRKIKGQSQPTKNERTSHLFVREQNTIEKTKETNTPKPVEPQDTWSSP